MTILKIAVRKTSTWRSRLS